MVAFDNYEGQIVAKRICVADFETYNNLRWAAMVPRVSLAGSATMPAPVVAREQARVEATSMVTERTALRIAYEKVRPEDVRKDDLPAHPFTDRISEISRVIGQKARIAAGVEAEYQDTVTRGEAALREYGLANEARNNSQTDTAAHQSAEVNSAQLWEIANRYLNRRDELKKLAYQQIPGLEEYDP